MELLCSSLNKVPAFFLKREKKKRMFKSSEGNMAAARKMDIKEGMESRRRKRRNNNLNNNNNKHGLGKTTNLHYTDILGATLHKEDIGKEW